MVCGSRACAADCRCDAADGHRLSTATLGVAHADTDSHIPRCNAGPGAGLGSMDCTLASGPFTLGSNTNVTASQDTVE